MHNLLGKSLAGSVALAALAASAATGQAADITISDAAIAGGKLVITGTASPNSWVRLDGQAGSDFNVKSGADGRFAFGVVYHPGDCIVDLQRLISPATLGASTPALVADCGPRGVSPRGAWSATAPYLTNDLVTYLGSTWRAKRSNINKSPVVGVDWELFAAGSAAASEAAGDPDVEPLAPPDGPAGGDLTGTYPNPTLKAAAVTTGKIADGAVSTSKIAPLSVGSGRLADNAVTSAKLAAGAITYTKLASDAVTTGKIADAAITNLKIAANAVTSDKIANSSLSGDDIASSSLTGIDVANGSLTGSDILDESLGTSDVADGSITTADLAISSVTGSRIAAGAVTSSDVANRSLTTDDMDLAERSGSIDVGAISNGRCTTITGSVTGALPGDVAILTTNGDLPSGMLVYAQRALTNAIHIKVCNLSGATSAAITDLPVRVLSFH